jgi:hypothetical protein
MKKKIKKKTKLTLADCFGPLTPIQEAIGACESVSRCSALFGIWNESSFSVRLFLMGFFAVERCEIEIN